MNMRPASGVSLFFACAAVMGTGCAAPGVDFSKIHRPSRASELDAYDIFVGDWTWEAEALNADPAHKKWTGAARWEWALDRRCLHGQMSLKSADTEFQTAGVWTWHPLKKEHIWTMFNNWGYPQSGTARYNPSRRHWMMTYSAVGLDGTSSYGVYDMTVVDNDHLRWSLTEWADPLHFVKKLEMSGTYTRTKQP